MLQAFGAFTFYYVSGKKNIPEDFKLQMPAAGFWSVLLLQFSWQQEFFQRESTCKCLLQAFGPFVFYDVAGKEIIPEGSSSIVNRVEVEMVLCVYRELVHLHPDLRTTPSVAVISP